MYIQLCVKNVHGFSKYTVKYLKGHCVCNSHPYFQKETYTYLELHVYREEREKKIK